MRLCSIASGSSGNCIYVEGSGARILVDAGVSKKRMEESLAALGVEPETISGILVTHEHFDHIYGLGAFSRQYRIPIYATGGTIAGIEACRALGKMPPGLYREVTPDREWQIEDLRIRPFSISHDANEPSGFRIMSGGKSLAVATDMGKYDEYIVENLKELDAIVLEANHDVHMVEAGPYPYPLKQRILGDQGHLSNELSGRLLCRILHKGLKYVMLAHLSKENNYEELALETVKLEVTLGDTPFRGEEVLMLVAQRDRISEILDI